MSGESAATRSRSPPASVRSSAFAKPAEPISAEIHMLPICLNIHVCGNYIIPGPYPTNSIAFFPHCKKRVAEFAIRFSGQLFDGRKPLLITAATAQLLLWSAIPFLAKSLLFWYHGLVRFNPGCCAPSNQAFPCGIGHACIFTSTRNSGYHKDLHERTHYVRLPDRRRRPLRCRFCP